jgi:hypothetical protein
MVRPITNNIDIGGAEALLDGCEPLAWWGFVTSVIGLERCHPSGGEEQGGVAGWDEGGTWHHKVTARFEKTQVSLTYLIACEGTLCGH